MRLIGIDALILRRGDHAGHGAALIRSTGAKTGGAHCVAAGLEVAIQRLALRDRPRAINLGDPECTLARLTLATAPGQLYAPRRNKEKTLGRRRTVTTQTADAIMIGDILFAVAAASGIINRFGGGT